jgi:hypothetical protein
MVSGVLFVEGLSEMELSSDRYWSGLGWLLAVSLTISTLFERIPDRWHLLGKAHEFPRPEIFFNAMSSETETSAMVVSEYMYPSTAMIGPWISYVDADWTESLDV